MKIFSLDSPFFQFMEKVADYFIVNILTALLFLPVITGGAAITAAHKVMQNFASKNEQPIVRTYFKTFAAEFKQSTIVWLIVLGILGLLVGNIFLVYLNFSGNLAFFLYLALGIASVVFLGTAAFAFPMIARYENTLKQHLRNSLLLAIGNLPKTILMLALYAIPVAILVASVQIFFNTLFIWLLFGIALIINLETRIIFPIFQKLEDVSEEDAENTETEN